MHEVFQDSDLTALAGLPRFTGAQRIAYGRMFFHIFGFNAAYALPGFDDAVALYRREYPHSTTAPDPYYLRSRFNTWYAAHLLAGRAIPDTMCYAVNIALRSIKPRSAAFLRAHFGLDDGVMRTLGDSPLKPLRISSRIRSPMNDVNPWGKSYLEGKELLRLRRPPYLQFFISSMPADMRELYGIRAINRLFPGTRRGYYLRGREWFQDELFPLR